MDTRPQGGNYSQIEKERVIQRRKIRQSVRRLVVCKDAQEASGSGRDVDVRRWVYYESITKEDFWFSSSLHILNVLSSLLRTLDLAMRSFNIAAATGLALAAHVSGHGYIYQVSTEDVV